MNHKADGQQGTTSAVMYIRHVGLEAGVVVRDVGARGGRRKECTEVTGTDSPARSATPLRDLGYARHGGHEPWRAQSVTTPPPLHPAGNRGHGRHDGVNPLHYDNRCAKPIEGGRAAARGCNGRVRSRRPGRAAHCARFRPQTGVWYGEAQSSHLVERVRARLNMSCSIVRVYEAVGKLAERVQAWPGAPGPVLPICSCERATKPITAGADHASEPGLPTMYSVEHKSKLSTSSGNTGAWACRTWAHGRPTSRVIEAHMLSIATEWSAVAKIPKQVICGQRGDYYA